MYDDRSLIIASVVFSLRQSSVQFQSFDSFNLDVYSRQSDNICVTRCTTILLASPSVESVISEDPCNFSFTALAFLSAHSSHLLYLPNVIAAHAATVDPEPAPQREQHSAAAVRTCERSLVNNPCMAILVEVLPFCFCRLVSLSHLLDLSPGAESIRLAELSAALADSLP